MSWIHRTGSDCYPENSVEAVISSCMMGVDIIEVDVRITKDGIPVLIHNENLTVTTDFSTAGLDMPETVSECTLAELRRLKLKGGRDGNGVQTDYVIPTLKEALTVAKNRCFISCDMKNTSTRYEDFVNFVLPVIEETGAYETVILGAWMTDSQISDVRTAISNIEYNTERIQPYCVRNLDYSSTDWSDVIENVGEKTIFRLNGFVSSTDGNLNTNLSEDEKLVQIRETVRLVVDGYYDNRAYENVTTWNECMTHGINIVFVEQSIVIQNYIITKYYRNNYSLLY